MKRIFFTSILFALVFVCAAQQSTVKPKAKSKPKTAAKTAVKKPALQKNILGFSVIKEDGSNYMYYINQGDKLVYHVNAFGKEYDFIVTVNAYDYNKGIDFNYEMTAPASKTGHVKIAAKAFQSSKKYTNYFSGGELNLTDACTVWLCYDNFSDMPQKQTTITMDNDEPETFYRADNDEANMKVNFKGEEVTIEGFSINNKEDQTGDKTLVIQNGSFNPLILKMNLGWTIELKEIR